MRPVHWIAPVGALAGAAVVLGRQHHQQTIVEEQITQLRVAIAQAREAADEAGADGSIAANEDPTAKKIDWKETGEALAKMRTNGGTPDMRVFIKLQEQILSMDKDEMVAAFEEIGSLELSAQARQMLEGTMLTILAQKDPQLALELRIERMDSESGYDWVVISAIQKWAEKDPVAAAAWIDKQAAAGKLESKQLDGKESPRVQLEAQLIQKLLEKNPAMVQQRLDALPEEQRMEVVKKMSYGELSVDSAVAYAGLVKKNLPEDERAELLAQRAGYLATGKGYDEVASYLTQIDATPEERGACVASAVSSKMFQEYQKTIPTREDFDAMRQWAATQAPEAVDMATGKALEQCVNYGAEMKQRDERYVELAKIAEQYHDEGAGDEILLPLFGSYHVRNNKEVARGLAGKIRNEENRNRILKSLE